MAILNAANYPAPSAPDTGDLFCIYSGADSDTALMTKAQLFDLAGEGTLQVILPLSLDAVTPTLAFGDGDTGFYEAADDRIQFARAGSAILEFGFSGAWQIVAAATPTTKGAIRANLNSSATDPQFCPMQGDATTGIGGISGELSIITGGVEAINVDAAQSVTVANSLYMTEQAAALGDTATQGQLWVKNTTPCELWFTDDTGTDLDLLNNTYANIYVSGGSTAQTSITSAVLMTGFATDGPSNDCTAAAASDKITVSRAGDYKVSFSNSFVTSASNVVVTFTIYVDGSPTTLICKRKIGTGGDEGTTMCQGVLAIAAAKDVEVYVAADGSTSMTPNEAQLTVERVGA